MGIIGIVSLLAVAILHYYIFVIEVFFWNKKLGRKVFHLTEEFANTTNAMAINQGFYNGFLASGLLYAVVINNSGTGLFFLSCIAIAGIVGGITSNKRIIVVQTIPSLLSGIFVLFNF